MIGELEYHDMLYKEDLRISAGVNGTHVIGDVIDDVRVQIFPLSAQAMVTIFIIFVSIIIMNFLFGLAVHDVEVVHSSTV